MEGMLILKNRLIVMHIGRHQKDVVWLDGCENESPKHWKWNKSRAIGRAMKKNKMMKKGE